MRPPACCLEIGGLPGAPGARQTSISFFNDSTPQPAFFGRIALRGCRIATRITVILPPAQFLPDSDMTRRTNLHVSARRVARRLKARNLKIVFAESCTGGLISAALTRIPGISSHLCGSAVVYQIETKNEWLGVAPGILKNPGPVSEPVARAMAEGVLAKTPQADLSASITGHLGPDSPPGQDGLLYCAVATRKPARRAKRFDTVIVEHWLTASRAKTPSEKTRLRIARQAAAADFVLSEVLKSLEHLQQ
jgi:PncC family amidohydrolase